jgi:hypothetical protein
MDLSDLGPDTTTLIINWNWDCPDDAPPPIQVASVTPCTGCNINISVRVASPGDSASVTQSTQVDASAIASTVAEATQAAAQTVVPPQPPVVSPPSPPQPPSAPSVPSVSAPVSPTPPTPPAATAPAAVTPTSPAAPTAPAGASVVTAPPRVSVTPPPGVAADTAPRHAAPFLTAPFKPEIALHKKKQDSQGVELHRVRWSTAVRSISVVHVRTVVRYHERAAQPGGRAPLPFPPPASPPAPGAFAPATSSTQGPGGFTPTALATGGIGLALLMFLAYAAPGLQTVRPRPAQANPDPPG